MSIVDTHKLIQSLCGANMPEEQAQAIATALAEAETTQLATKADMEGIRTDFARLDGKFDKLTWMVGTLVVINLGILAKLLFT